MKKITYQTRAKVRNTNIYQNECSASGDRSADRKTSLGNQSLNKQNSDLNGRYRACYADDMATIRKERFVRRRKLTTEMEVHIIEKIRSEQWSPEQIKGHADTNGIPMVSHESAYKMIRADKVNGGDLYKSCRHGLKHRSRLVGDKAVIIKDKRSIE